MSDANEIVNKIQELIIDEIKKALPTIKDKQYYFIETAADDSKDGNVLLKSGKIASVLNNGSIKAGDTVAIIRTSDDSLWAYYPPFGGFTKFVEIIAGKGYFAGGWNSPGGVPYFSLIDGINFENESSFVLGNNLSVARHGVTGMSSSEKAYFKGGVGFNYEIYLGNVDILKFSDESLSVIYTDVHGDNDVYPCSVSSDLAGYTTSTFWSVCPLTRVIKLLFANETFNFLVENLEYLDDYSRERRILLSAGVNSQTDGYYGGGTVDISYDANPELFKALLAIMGDLSSIQGIKFANDTIQLKSAVLFQKKYGLMGISSSEKGYFLGGDQPCVSSIDALIFNTETCNVLGSYLNSNLALGAGVNSTDKGYLGGGRHSYADMADHFQCLEFHTETTSVLTSSISQERAYVGGASSE